MTSAASMNLGQSKNGVLGNRLKEKQKKNHKNILSAKND